MNTCEDCVNCTVRLDYNYCEYYNDYFDKNDSNHLCESFEKDDYTRKEKIIVELMKKEDPNFFDDGHTRPVKESLEDLLHGIYDFTTDFGRCCEVLAEVYDKKYFDFDDDEWEDLKKELKKDRKELKEYDLFEIDLRKKVLIDTVLIKLIEIIVSEYKVPFLEGKLDEDEYESIMFRNCL